MVVMSQTVNWAPIMYKVMNSGGIDNVPGYKTQPFISIFFILFIIFGAFFIINLFVGVIISAYNREIERSGNNFLLTSEQKKKLETKMLVLSMKPLLSQVKTNNSKCRSVAFDIASNKVFEYFILGAIAANTLAMTLKWPNMSQKSVDIIEKVNYVFLAIFCFEAVIKLVAYGKRYFKDAWNTFDFIIVIVSIIFIVV